MANLAQSYAALLQKKNFVADVLTSPYVWEPVDPKHVGETRKLFGICRHCMQGDCATIVHMEDGVVTKVEGNDLPPNHGALCPRGNAAIMGLYNPYRVKTPMVRTNPEKGLDVDPKWKEVTWDEALDLTAQKLREGYEYDPRSLVIAEGWGNRDTLLRPHFGHAMGTPNEVGSHGALCTVHYATGLIHGNFPVSLPDLEYCNYHITIGRSLGANFATTHGSRRMMNAIERGMKLVVVDPRCSHEASKGEWVPIRPCSDLPFILAFAHVMMFEHDGLDWVFLKNRTNATYLIGPDGDYVRDPDSGKPLVWDSVSDRPVPFNTPGADPAMEGRHTVNGVDAATAWTLIRERFAAYTPEWAEPQCDVPAATIRRIAGEFVEAAQVGSTIEIEGTTFPLRPACMNLERNSMNHRYGVYADLVGKMINMMVGAIEVPGGCLGSGYRGPNALRPTADGTMAPGYEAVPRPWAFPPDHVGMTEFFPHSHTTPHVVVQVLENPEEFYLDYEVKCWLTVGANMIRTNAEPDRYVRMFQKIPFHANIAYHIDEMAVMADVLLPEHSFMERLRVFPFYPSHQSIDADLMGLHMIQLRQPVPRIFNTRHVDEILLELAERTGRLYGPGGLYDCLNNAGDFLIQEHGFVLRDPYKLDINTKHSFEEILDRWVRSWMFNEEGVGLEELNQRGCLINRQPKKTFYHYYHWPDNQTKHEFYFMNLKRTADSLRQHIEENHIQFPVIHDLDQVLQYYNPIPYDVTTSEADAPPEYDLYAINWKPPYVSSDVGNIVGNPWMAEMYQKDPFEGGACLNPETAKRKGLKDGDYVRISSRYGSIEGPIVTSQRFHPDCIGISGAYGPGNFGSNPLNRAGLHFNRLLSVEFHTLDLVTAGQEVSPRVKVEKIARPSPWKKERRR